MPKTCPAGKIRRKAYTTRKGVKVKSTCVPDKGKPGKGPKTLPSPKPGALTGWQKALPQKERLRVLKSLTKEQGCGVVINKLNLLRNITADKPTKKAAASDMRRLRKQAYCRLKGG